MKLLHILTYYSSTPPQSHASHKEYQFIGCAIFFLLP
jgi:hypothetical protein